MSFHENLPSYDRDAGIDYQNSQNTCLHTLKHSGHDTVPLNYKSRLTCKDSSVSPSSVFPLTDLIIKRTKEKSNCHNYTIGDLLVSKKLCAASVLSSE